VSVIVRTNLPDFKRAMDALGRAFGPKVARPAAAAAAAVFRKAVKAHAPKDTGRLKAAVYIRRERDSKRGLEHYLVAVKSGPKARAIKRKRGTVNLDAYYWRFLEAGWVPRQPGSGVRGGGRNVRALRRRRAVAGGAREHRHPFIAPAFRSARFEALRVFYAKAESALAKVNKKP
jgi:HK97 gp10 family phage protein